MMHGVEDVKTSLIFHLCLFQEVLKESKLVSDRLQSNDGDTNKCKHDSPSCGSTL
jgi:hypothetical protein